MQLLQVGARRKETCLYIALSESGDEIGAVVASHGWTLDGTEIADSCRR
jgi:circadian clock protein KaiC